MAVQAVFSTYELVEQIMLGIPRGYVYRAAQISKTCRSVRADSFVVNKYLAALEPLTAADIKPFTHTEWSQVDTPVPGVPFSSITVDFPNAFNMVADMYASGKALRPISAIPFQTWWLGSRPHYGFDNDTVLSVHDGLSPRHRMSGICGKVVTVHLPSMAAVIESGCRPGDLVTDPPIVGARVELWYNGKSIDSCSVHQRTGLTFRELMRAQKRMLEVTGMNEGTVMAGRELECVVSFVKDVDAQKLRSGLPADFEQ